MPKTPKRRLRPVVGLIAAGLVTVVAARCAAPRPMPARCDSTDTPHRALFDAGPAAGPAATPDEGPPFLEESGPLEGKVSNSGAPVADAGVEVLGTAQTSRTDARGEFAFPRVDCKLCQVRAQSGDSFGTAWASRPDDGPGRATIELHLPGSLRVAVVDGRSGAALSNASVDLVTIGSQELLVRSEGKGVFSARALESDTYGVRASAPGFLQRIRRVSIESSATAELRLELWPSHRLSGRVTDAFGAALAKAKVRVFASASEAVTDDDGAFSLESLAAGPALLKVTKAEFLPESVFVALPRPSPVAIKLRYANPVEFQVLKPNGEPADDRAWVQLVPPPSTYPFAKAVNPLGRVTFFLPPGAWVASAGTRGFLRSDEVRFETRRTDRPGGPAVRLALRVGAALAGRVVDAAGAPVAGARVECAPTLGLRDCFALTDDAGRFELRGLPPGRPALVANKDGYAPSSEVPGAPESSEVVLRLDRFATVQGRLTLEGAAVTEFSLGDHPFESARGAFRDDKVPPGQATLTFTGPFETLSLKRTLGPGEAVDLGEVLVSRAGAIEGLVAGATGQGDLFDVYAWASDGGATRRETSTDAKGAFRFEHLPSGLWRLSGQSPSGRSLQPKSVQLAASAEVRVTLLPVPPAKLVLTARTRAGAPVVGLELSLLASSTAERLGIEPTSSELCVTPCQHALTNAAGEATISVPPDTYRVLVQPPRAALSHSLGSIAGAAGTTARATFVVDDTDLP
jgi:hypothetical protein